VLECYICGKSLSEPNKCILCEKYICQEHSRQFEVGDEKSDASEKKIYAYICDHCMEAVEELKSKPRDEWTEEDKTKSKGMIGKIIRALGRAGMVIITAIFAFALWLFAKGTKENGEPEQSPIVESDAKPGESATESMADTSFTEETTFEEDEPALQHD
jgi:hypothetical protein